MKKITAMILIALVGIPISMPALMEVQDEAQAMPEIPSLEERGYEIGSELGKRILEQLLKSSEDEGPFFFLDKIPWGISHAEIEPIAYELGMVRFVNLKNNLDSVYTRSMI